MKSLAETQNINSKNGFLNVCKGIVISFLFTLILLFLFSILLTCTNIEETVIPPVIIIITALSILIGASIGTVKIKKNGILYGGMIGIIYIASIYIISSIVETGFVVNGYSIAMILFSMIAGIIGGIVGVNIKK